MSFLAVRGIRRLAPGGRESCSNRGVGSGKKVEKIAALPLDIHSESTIINGFMNVASPRAAGCVKRDKGSQTLWLARVATLDID